MKDFWLIMNSWLLIICAFHKLCLDDYVIKVQTQQFHSFVLILTFIPVIVLFCFNKEVFIHWNQKSCNLYVTFLAPGHVATFSQQCSGPIAVFPAICWFWIGAFSLSGLYTTNWLGTDTPGVPLTPATIHLQSFKQKHLINYHRRHVWIIYPNKVCKTVVQSLFLPFSIITSNAQVNIWSR